MKGYLKHSCWHVTEILVRQKFWSGGAKFLENWSAGPLLSENFGPCVELRSERKYFGVSTFNDTRTDTFVSRWETLLFAWTVDILEVLAARHFRNSLSERLQLVTAHARWRKAITAHKTERERTLLCNSPCRSPCHRVLENAWWYTKTTEVAAAERDRHALSLQRSRSALHRPAGMLIITDTIDLA